MTSPHPTTPDTGPLPARLAERLAAEIAAARWGAGTRLPSVRRCAQAQGVGVGTVVQAYDLLQARGLIEARPQRGFFVRAAARGTARGTPAPAAPPALLPPVDATALIRGMLMRAPRPAGATHGSTRLIGPGPGQGTLPESWLDAELLGRALRHGLRDAAAQLSYGSPAGDEALRGALAERLEALGIACTPGQIVTTLGATQALDVVARTLFAPGDAVLVDEPGWAVEFARLQRQGVRLVPVPRAGDGGPDLDAVAALAATHAPRAYVTMSVLHNPTGHVLGAAAAHRLLSLAEQAGFLVVEDDSYGWLAPPHTPRLAALDGLRRTVHIGGFSKILAPDWRVGFIAAAPELAERCIDTKLLAALTTPTLTERAVAWCLARGALRRHAERVQARLEAAIPRVVKLAEAAGCRFVSPPRGLFGWADTGVDTERLAERLAAQGWLIAPGCLFSAERRPGSLMRLNFATAHEPRFWQAFAHARAALQPG